MNQKILESIELSPEMNRMVVEALMWKSDRTSLYATKLIMTLNEELKLYRSAGAPHAGSGSSKRSPRR